MTKEEIFDTWAPPSGVWSPWAKPVLFSSISLAVDMTVANDVGELDMTWASFADGATAIVVDLAGSAAIAAGLKLAAVGYRPVPLFNAIPDPAPWSAANNPSLVPSSAVNVQPIVTALAQRASDLAALQLAAEAPPAFLLDANRRGGVTPKSPGMFDNRSVSLPTDFPSANLLRSRGFTSVIVVQSTGSEPQPDLSHTLRRWQDAGLPILLKSLEETGAPVPVIVNRPLGFRLLWHNFLATIGLKRSPFGGFGGRLPLAASG